MHAYTSSTSFMTLIVMMISSSNAGSSINIQSCESILRHMTFNRTKMSSISLLISGIFSSITPRKRDHTHGHLHGFWGSITQSFQPRHTRTQKRTTFCGSGGSNTTGPHHHSKRHGSLTGWPLYHTTVPTRSHLASLIQQQSFVAAILFRISTWGELTN